MATLKSRQILAARQSSATASNSQYKDPNTWQKMAMSHKRVVTSKSWVDWVQNPLGIAGGMVSNAFQKVVSGEVLDGTPLEGLSLSSGALSYTKFWRYKLLFNWFNGMEKTQYSPRPTITSLITDALPFFNTDCDVRNKHITIPGSLSLAELDYPADEVNKIVARRAGIEGFTPVGRNYIIGKLKALEGIQKRRLNEVIIINASVSPYVYLTLQNRPTELVIDPKATWATINSMGRNNPFLMYTGGEDTISFDISWFANDPSHRDEVVWKCRLLESWTRADGYLASPPLLNIKWGSSEIFKDDDYFILESAKYTLSNFQDQARKPGTGDNIEAIDLKLNPACATQSLVFKRITLENTTHEDIVPQDKLQGISGITSNTPS